MATVAAGFLLVNNLKPVRLEVVDSKKSNDFGLSCWRR